MFDEKGNKIDIDLILDPPDKYEDYEEELEVGTITFSEVITEDEIDSGHRLNFGGKAGECKVTFLAKEGDYPHFHIKSSKKEKGKFPLDTCIRLDTNEYFDHGNHYDDELNSSQRKELEKWLNEEMDYEQDDGEIIKITRWEFMKRNYNGSLNQIENPIKIGSQPNYTTINPKGTLKKENKNGKIKGNK